MNAIERGEQRYYLTEIRYQQPSRHQVIVKVIRSKFIDMIDLVLVVTGVILVVGVYLLAGME